MRNHDNWVYILTNKHCTTLYIGITNNIACRLYQHRHGEVDGFTERYQLNRLVWIEHFRNVNGAISCEKKLKGWRRSRKVALIERTNPQWLDLVTSGNNNPSSIAAVGNRRNDQGFFASLRMTTKRVLLVMLSGAKHL